jgi:protein tyrosine phosphatase (PTP) superfamily phosphohydrolase (DUF442 family)
MRVSTLVASVLFTCGLFSSPAQPSQNSSQPTVNHSLPRYVAGVPDFAQVTPHFLRGGQPTREGFDVLRKMGVEVVIDLRGERESERREVQRLGMQYVAIPWHCPFPHDEKFARFLAVMRANSSRTVFVHCRLGDDRVGMMVAAYRMAEQRWTAEQAMQEMKASGFSRLHHLICPGLASYEKQFPERLRDNPAFQSLRDPQK